MFFHKHYFIFIQWNGGKMDQLTVSIFGLGWVGLCTAVSLAQKGMETICVDIDKSHIEMIQEGKPPFFEPGLETALTEILSGKNFRLTTDAVRALERSSISFITVGTPSRTDGGIDLRFVEAVSRDIGQALKIKASYHLIVVKSTVIPGTTENLVKPILMRQSQKRCGPDFGLCVNPEFLKEGSAMHDTLNPYRIIIGEYDNRSGSMLGDFYQTFYGEELPPVLRTNLTNAELIKYAGNAFLANKISFINTIANICEKILGADVATIAEGMSLDERISQHFLRAGLGYGGSCLPKDLKALISHSKEKGYEPQLLKSIEHVNDAQPLRAIEIAERLLGTVQDKRIAILGLAFKPDTDDIREAVSIKIINNLLQKGARVSVYDPVAMESAEKIFGEKINYTNSREECLKKTDCCVIVTEWDEFKSLTPEELERNMRTPILIDGRRITDPSIFQGRVKFAAIGLGVDR